MFFDLLSTFNEHRTLVKMWVSISTVNTFDWFVLTAGGELFMQLEREGIFMEDTAWWASLSVAGKVLITWPEITLVFSFPLTNSVFQVINGIFPPWEMNINKSICFRMLCLKSFHPLIHSHLLCLYAYFKVQPHYLQHENISKWQQCDKRPVLRVVFGGFSLLTRDVQKGQWC